MTLFLQSPDVFTDEFIIDELIDFFQAASATTASVTQTMISHFIKDNDSLEEVRKEFDVLLKEK